MATQRTWTVGGAQEQFVPMEPLAHRLRDRARELELSDAEVARRAGLAERRYGHYVRGAREPDLATLVRISAVLDLTPNDLLLRSPEVAAVDPWISRLTSAGLTLNPSDLRLAVSLVEAMIRHREREAT